MQRLDWTTLSPAAQKAALARPSSNDDTAFTANVATIVREVKTRGDAALRDFSAKFDKSTRAAFRLAPKEIDAATVTPALRDAMKLAIANITAFHEAERPHPVRVETMQGVECRLLWRPIETVGIYIPAGTAPLFSALLMETIPARIAGCRRIVLCTPPRDGVIHPAILVAARFCGIDEVYAVGGAQAIAAMAYGTASIPKVDKIFGPGNAYVTKAKQLVSQDPEGAAIDMPAGPSEVLVIAQDDANPAWVAADLLAQAEHDTVAQAILVTTSASLADRVQAEIDDQLTRLSRRAIATESLKESRIILVPDMATALDVSNRYAPEHLLLHNEDAEKYLPAVQHAGSVFLGPRTPEPFGDYASGTNHVLPTYGYARAYNGITVYSFMKSMSVQSVSPEGFAALAPTVITMAEAEGLDAHAAAVRVRLRNT